MKFAKMAVEEEVSSNNYIIVDLRNQGFTIELNDEGSNVYTVHKNGQSAILDLSTEKSMESSLETIQLAFKPSLNPKVISSVDSINNDTNHEYPIMGKGSDHKLAQRVAAISESTPTKLDVKATSSCRGKTYHHDVYLVQPDNMSQSVVKIDKTPGSWYLSTFMKGSGPLSIDLGSGWVLVNADEIRDYLVMHVLKQNFGNFIKRSGDQSFSESSKGLWYNIANKKKRMGKNYKPAKPGEKGRPDPKAFKNASKS